GGGLSGGCGNPADGSNPRICYRRDDGRQRLGGRSGSLPHRSRRGAGPRLGKIGPGGGTTPWPAAGTCSSQQGRPGSDDQAGGELTSDARWRGGTESRRLAANRRLADLSRSNLWGGRLLAAWM